MKLFLRVPLCWFGREVYDAAYDELRGGWLWAGMKITFERTNWPRGLMCCVRVFTYWRFPPMSVRP